MQQQKDIKATLKSFGTSFIEMFKGMNYKSGVTLMLL